MAWATINREVFGVSQIVSAGFLFFTKQVERAR
jgi:hypothetical protein